MPGDGDIHRLILRVASYDSLEFWMDRFIANDVFSELLRLDPTQPQSIVFHDPEGHEVELMVSDTKDAPLVADADDIPAEHRIRGIEGARSYTTIEAMLPVRGVHGLPPGRRPPRLRRPGAQRALVLLSAPTGRPSNDGRVGVWHHIAYDAGDQKELQAARDEAADRPAAVDGRLRPLLLRLVLHDDARRAHGDVHDRPGVSDRRGV